MEACILGKRRAEEKGACGVVSGLEQDGGIQGYGRGEEGRGGEESGGERRGRERVGYGCFSLSFALFGHLSL